uniref:OCRE domain-containing protein n=1 Tax=Davidia involucrata TaxID=16924 RepID=A0A5B6YUU9_DAVIN
MAGSTESGHQEFQNNECAFEWDEKSQLYFHASTGFYYDPSAGWYYSSKDGLYYKFENGNYVLLESDKGDQSEINQCGGTVPDEPATVHTECMNNDLPENPPPPSEWLEDTLIDLYLSGYSNQATNVAHDMRMPVEADDGDNLNLSADGLSQIFLYLLRERLLWLEQDLNRSALLRCRKQRFL